MKVFVLQPNEGWVCDRFADEWRRVNPDITTHDPNDADVLWLLAGWCWNHLPTDLLSRKKVVATIHHIDPDKFNDEAKREFIARDQFVDTYHVPCARTSRLITQLTSKPIFVQPFWVNSRLWTPQHKATCREKYGLPLDKFIIGSFQRDTEGSDLITPKLAKGPDVFVDVVEEFNRSKKYDVHVLLAGWRRQYVIKRLTAARIPYTYFELPTFDVVNEFYNSLDLYVVGSRHEGGPQAVFECAATQTPIISTPVGFAENILGDTTSHHIYEISPDGKYPKLPELVKRLDPSANYERVIDYFMPQGMGPFVRLFSRMLK